MIPKYIENWLEIVEKMSNTTTYKLAWGRAIIECVTSKQYNYYDETSSCIDIKNIANNVLKYYWNQYYFFHLKQAGAQAQNKSVIMENVIKLIEVYQNAVKNTYPEWFEKASVKINQYSKKEYENCISRISSNLLSNPCKYFLHVEGETYFDIYKRVGSKIIIFNENLKYIDEYSSILIQILNYRWTQLLEDYNFAPKITQKVDKAANSKIKRESLKHFIKFLILTTDNKPVDFYTGKELDSNDISVDHVIPWSFMYSDDIWNLVLTTKSHNSSKSNTPPTDEDIKRLNLRNKELISYVEDIKYKNSLKEAIDNHYVDKFYNNCKYDFKI